MTQQFKFIIPQKLEDLLHPQEDHNIYYVNDELTALEIGQKLPETENNLHGDPLAISQEFGLFFSVLKNFSELDSRMIDRTWILIFKTTNSFREQLRDIFNVLNESISSQNASLHASQISHNNSREHRSNLFESIQEKLRFSNALKMIIYLNCTYINHFEDTLASQSHRQNFNETLTDATPARKKKKRQVIDNGHDISFKEYDRYKERVMKNMLQLVSMPLNKVADSLTEARDIVGQAMRVCYKMIENSSINSLPKHKDLLEIIFSVLGVGIEKYNQSLSFCLKFIQLLQYRDQLAPLLADLFEFIVTRHDQRLLVGEVLREIDRIDIKDLSRDSSFPRAVQTFLVILSEKCPREFTPSLNHMFDHLEQDSYIMRNASLAVITNIVIKVLREKEDDKASRDELLDVLLAHIRDTTGYTRSKALSLWCTLCENGCIPNSYITPVTQAAVGRLMDKACLVRKNALRFIINVLSRNPFELSTLPLSLFLERYAAEKALLEKLLEEEKEKVSRQEEICETLSQGSQNDTITSETDPEEIHPAMKIKNLALAEESPVDVQRRKVNYLKDAITFTKQIHKAIPITTEMLSSKNITDVTEAIDFFVHCHEYGIDEALVGFKRMIMLIRSEEKSVKENILAAYKRIFFESSRYEGKSNRDSLIVSNFINFVQAANIGECISLEALIGHFHTSGDLTKSMERELWARFTKAKLNTTTEESIAAIQLIGMLASSRPETISHNLQLCLQFGFNTNGCTEQDSRLVRETCIAIRKSLPRKIEDKRRTLRLSKDDEIFVRLGKILVTSLSNMTSEHWFSMCDEAMRIIFDMAENPEKISESIYSQMVDVLLKNAVQSNSLLTQDTNRNESPELVFQPSSMQVTGTGSTQQTQNHTMELVHPIALARFIHFLGDVALNLAVYLELHVLVELKLRGAASNDASANNISAHNISISSRRRSRRYGADLNKSIEDQNLEEEIGLGGAEAEDAEMEFIGYICDEELVCGKNLLAKLSRVIIEVVKEPARYPHAELKQASSLALAKFMMVSAKYCHDHLRLLFTVLEKSKDKEIKINLLVAISDLCIRFPNQLDGWTGKIFDCLQSEEVSVRRAAMKILSRLVLCDILKAKDQISTMANLIVDDDEQIASYSRHFFLELSKKLNAIYNVLPDIISRLSDSNTGISEENFRIVMRFMFDLIDKSHHIDRLVDKLCCRFMDTVDERHWSDLAYCLSLLKYSDKSMTKLFDKFDCYKDKLCIDPVKDSIMAAISNHRKTSLKNEMKQLLDEFEAKIAKSIGDAKEESMAQEESMAREESIVKEESMTEEDSSGQVPADEETECEE